MLEGVVIRNTRLGTVWKMFGEYGPRLAKKHRGITVPDETFLRRQKSRARMFFWQSEISIFLYSQSFSLVWVMILETFQPFPKQALVTSNLSLSQCFLSVWRTSFHFHQILNCDMQTLSVWKSVKFVVWERVKQETCKKPLNTAHCLQYNAGLTSTN